MDKWKLRFAFAKSGMDKTEIAKRSGVTRTTLDNLLGDERDCKVGTLESVCATLGISVAEMFSGEPEPEEMPVIPSRAPRYIERRDNTELLASIGRLVDMNGRLMEKITKLLGDERERL